MAPVETKGRRVNGLDVDALTQVIREVERDPAKGQAGSLPVEGPGAEPRQRWSPTQSADR